MHTKRWYLIIIVVILLAVVGWFNVQIYRYYHPDFIPDVSKADKNIDCYIETVSFEIRERSLFGASSDLYYESYDTLEKIHEKFYDYKNKYQAPTHIVCEIDKSWSELKITYSGRATDKNGNACDIYDVLEFDRFW